MEAENCSATESGDFGFEHVVQTDAMPSFSDVLQQQARAHFNHGIRTSDRSKLQKKLNNKSSSNFADEHNKQNELQEENSVYDKLYNLTVENGQLRTEIQTVKTNYKLLLEKNNTLVATLEAKEQKLLVAELEMKMMSTTTKQNQMDNTDLITKVMTEEVISKSENKMMVKVVDNSTSSLQVQIGKLEAKLDLVEQNSNLSKVEMAKQVEAKMKEMADQLEEKQQKFIQENERKFSELESKVVEKDKKIEQMEKEGKFLEQEMAALEAKVDSLVKQQQEQKTSDIVDFEHSDHQQQQQLTNINNNCQSLLRNVYSLLYYKLNRMASRLRHAAETKMFSTKTAFGYSLHNCWGKWNADVTVDDLLDVTKFGSQFNYGNVMAKYAYPTFYFEVTVKKLNGFIHIGMSDKDFTADGNVSVGEISVSCSFASHGLHSNYLENYLEDFTLGRFGTNDTVGCGVASVAGTEKRVLFATKNGSIFETPVDLSSNVPKKLFPSITMYGQGTCVETNFGDDLTNKPFKFNIAEHEF